MTDQTPDRESAVNDLEEIRRLIEAVRPGSKKQTTVSEVLVDMSSFYERSRNEFLPHLIDEVERLREEVRELAAEKLRNEMSELSETVYCSSWEVGIEFEIWNSILGTPFCLQEETIDTGTRERFRKWIDGLKVLSNQCGGWWIWRGEDRDGKFIPLSEWLPMFAEWEKKQEAKA